MKWLGALVMLAACGRVSFDPVSDGRGQVAETVTGRDPMVPPVMSGAPERRVRCRGSRCAPRRPHPSAPRVRTAGTTVTP